MTAAVRNNNPADISGPAPMDREMTADVKTAYARIQKKGKTDSRNLNRRLFDTYDRVARGWAATSLAGTNVDLGCGDGGFSGVCAERGIVSEKFDYPGFDLEKAFLPRDTGSVDFVTYNAVIEHIENTDHILRETVRILTGGGLVFMRTPNWILDYRNFYNDPTHRRPYTPKSIRKLLEYFGMTVLFVEPGLICKSGFYWRVPKFMKWQLASLIPGGTRSILCMARKG